MAWKIEFDPRALTELAAIDRQHQRRLLRFLHERVAPGPDPRAVGEALRGPFAQLWKYRVGDYRIICDIQDRVVRVLVLRIGHRREIYRR